MRIRPLHSRFGRGLLGGWLIRAVGVARQRRLVVGALYRMGDTGRTAATRYVETIT